MTLTEITIGTELFNKLDEEFLADIFFFVESTRDCDFDTYTSHQNFFSDKWEDHEMFMEVEMALGF